MPIGNTKSLRLDGGTEHLQLSSPGSDFDGSQYTILCWFEPTFAVANQTLVSRWLAAGNHLQWILYVDNTGRVNWNWSSNGSANDNVIEVLPGFAPEDPELHDALAVDEWRFYGVTHDATDVQLFLDGTPLGASGSGGTIHSGGNADFNIGADDDQTVMAIGHIKHAMIWNTVLTDEQILAQKDAAEPLVTTGLIGWWPLIENITDYRDMSGSGHNMTAVGTLSYAEDVPAGVEPIAETSGSGKPLITGCT